MQTPSLPPGYRCLEKIASGTYGVVWKALNREESRCEAVKVLHQPGPKKWQLLYRVLSSIKHPNISTIYHVESKGEYFIMEYLGGGTLASLIEIEDFPIFAGLDIIRQVAEGIHYAHTKKILHLDLKPENVLFSHRMAPKITDFGISQTIAKDSSGSLLQTQLSTPQYMAPEQWENDEVDHKADIWALGMILYQLLANTLPFPELSGIHLAKVILMQPIPLPQNVNPQIKELARIAEPICMRALERNKQKRYHTAGEMAQELHKILKSFRQIVTAQSQRASKSEKKLSSLCEKIRKCYGFSGEESHACVNRRCRNKISFQDIREEKGFYDRINKRYLCRLCFSQTKPILAGYPLIGLDRRPTSSIFVAWDKEIQEPLLLRKSIKESHEMIERGQRILAILGTIESEYLFDMLAWAPFESKVGNHHYMMKEYMAGSYLSWLVPPFTYQETVYLLREICRGLYELHREGLVHRSLAPSSIFVDVYGKIRIGNMVLTKFSKQDWLLKTGQTLTQADTPLGVLEYMSPEQIDCALEVDQRTDIWGIGILAFYLITGKLPFSGSNFIAKAMSIKNTPVEIPNTVPEPLSMVIEKCLFKDKNDRYPNIAELRREVENLDG